MAVITFPQSILPAKSPWGIKSNTLSHTSPLNGAVQTMGRPGARWKATLEYPMLNLTQGAQMEAFLAQMDGMANRCYVTPHHRPGTGAAATVAGANQTGSVLALACAANRVFNAGDYFTVNGEMKIVTATTVANGSGAVSLPFAPMLRASPSNGATVTFTNPTCLMMLAQDEFAMPRISGPRYDPISLPLIEAFV